MSSIIRIIVIVMTNMQVDILINEYNEKERERRNRMLRARLARPCSEEELLRRLGGLAEEVIRHKMGQIPLTKDSAHYIMECAR